MWNGNAAILNPIPVSTASRPTVSHGSAGAFAMVARLVLPVAPYTNDKP
jgi:hypothetical protein